MLPHPLTKTEMKIHYQNEFKFKQFYLRDNLPKIIMDGAHKVNLRKHKSIKLTG